MASYTAVLKQARKIQQHLNKHLNLVVYICLQQISGFYLIFAFLFCFRYWSEVDAGCHGSPKSC